MILVLVALACVSSGCRKEAARERQELDFTVCAQTELPDDLRGLIEEKKLHAFQLSYTTKEHLYIVVGYGEHDRTNLCVVVEELYKTDRAIYVKTNLKTMESMEGAGDGQSGEASRIDGGTSGVHTAGDGQSDKASRIDGGTSGVHTAGDGQSGEASRMDAEPSMYPYIVIRLPRMDLPVLNVSQ